MYRRDGRVLRQVNASFGERWDALESSGLLKTLQDRALLIDHQPVSPGDALRVADAHAVIAPERIEDISYPYEWSFEQLKDAALLTLEAQSVAAGAGFAMRDASAFNVQFLRGRPILIDTLSFERDQPERPWNAYRQYCEHFLAPLALMAHRDPRCGLLLREFIDGVPVDLASTLLPGRTKLDFGLASHIHAHAGALRRAARMASTPPPRRPGTSPLRKSALLDNLRRTVEKLSWEPGGTAWADYADNTSYSAIAAASKDQLVRRFIDAAGGTVVWDLGANVGRFSAIAASLGRRVVAWDTDPAATDRHYRDVRRTGETAILPLLVDLANPSPGLGWGGLERRSMFERANADIVLALALVHHLAIGRNVPLPMVVDLFANLAPHLVVEFIPAADPMVERLMGLREDVFPYPSIEGFRVAFERRFHILEDESIEASGRRLLRMARR